LIEIFLNKFDEVLRMIQKNFLREIKINLPKGESEYPYNLPTVKNTKSILFNNNVTFFVGENGTGKSTLMEAIAIKLGLNPEGGSKNFTFETNKTHSNLCEYITLVRGVYRPKTSYFFRSESFYNLATNIDLLDDNTGTLQEVYGGESLHGQSHGESFLSLFENRFYSNGLYILDEPEVALSPMRQLNLLKIMNDLCNAGSQFIIATHSPILMAFPNADIYSFDNQEIKQVNYEDTEHYNFTKYFLGNYKKYFKYLFEDDYI
jgi:predicted ATPase